MLDIKNVSKNFGDKQVLKNISLTVKPGEIAFLLGPSGVGKSTLLRLLNGLETVSSGALLLDGSHVRPGNAGMVFQQFNLFDHMTVQDNITFPLQKSAKKNPEEARAIAHTLLKRYGLEDKSALYPAQLSGGQKQRLAIARSLALKPTIICLDEPTSALDPLLTNHVAHAIQDLAQEGYIVLVASHDIGLLQNLDCTIYLLKQSGELLERASSQEFKQTPHTFPHIQKFIDGE